MWIEVINENENFLIGQYRDTVESSPDYHGVKDQEAFLEFRKKVENYKQVGFYTMLATRRMKMARWMGILKTISCSDDAWC